MPPTIYEADLERFHFEGLAVSERDYRAARLVRLETGAKRVKLIDSSLSRREESSGRPTKAVARPLLLLV